MSWIPKFELCLGQNGKDMGSGGMGKAVGGKQSKIEEVKNNSVQSTIPS